jgi:hypothetical protein
VTEETRYKSFLSELEEYIKGLDAWMKAQFSIDKQERSRTSYSFSKWLSEHMERDPLG